MGDTGLGLVTVAPLVPLSVSHSALVSALSGNIYLHKLDQEIGRIRQKYEILIVQRVMYIYKYWYTQI